MSKTKDSKLVTLSASAVSIVFILFKSLNKLNNTNDKESNTIDTNKLLIRNIDSSKDIKAIYLIGKETFPEAYELWDNSQMYPKFLTHYIVPKYSFVMLNQLKQIVGFCFVTFQRSLYKYPQKWQKFSCINANIKSQEIGIALIGVKKEYRRNGIGYKLMTKSIQTIEKDIVDFKIFKKLSMVFGVRQSNIIAQSLYSKLGFVIIGKTNYQYDCPKEWGFRMKKDLN